MKRLQLVEKRDRRASEDRRSRTRGGRRADDPQATAQCPACSSRDIERASVAPGAVQFHCAACRETWVMPAAEGPEKK
jgi:hypothetical protein